ncbi:hypothetical protein SAMN05421810_102208 [Amycolatopsis arida]|uniref:Uncharacterized protein n=1 Tax=Amycolatopsis arida TaxID=587909 RepID=A0A1I5P9N3_9PSEU|nr:hypothetical protein CLV69_101208 [Amycolatopsis arida]SFP30819.1 hypothetical protein SAMN05421810_102208 [Amycolatopsis arida]
MFTKAPLNRARVSLAIVAVRILSLRVAGTP